MRIHICWGNYAGPHHHDIDAGAVWPAVAKVSAKYVLIEAANPRHGHEIAAFEKAVASGATAARAMATADPGTELMAPGSPLVMQVVGGTDDLNARPTTRG